jgi:hypothetical protein
MRPQSVPEFIWRTPVFTAELLEDLRKEVELPFSGAWGPEDVAARLNYQLGLAARHATQYAATEALEDENKRFERFAGLIDEALAELGYPGALPGGEGSSLFMCPSSAMKKLAPYLVGEGGLSPVPGGPDATQARFLYPALLALAGAGARRLVMDRRKDKAGGERRTSIKRRVVHELQEMAVASWVWIFGRSLDAKRDGEFVAASESKAATWCRKVLVVAESRLQGCVEPYPEALAEMLVSAAGGRDSGLCKDIEEARARLNRKNPGNKIPIWL